MPTVEESGQERETFGNAPGWSERQKSDAVPSASQDAVGESSTPDAETAPSAVESQEQVSQEGTAPSTQPEPEKKWNQPPEERWEELRQQRADAQARAEKAEALAQLALQKLQTPQAPSQPEVDPYAGMDAPTAEFYRNLDRRNQQQVQAIVAQQLQGYAQALDAGRRELAEVKINQFRQSNPDIKPNSKEEAAIAGFVSQGYDLSTSKKLALFDSLETENRALKAKQSTIPTKRAANTEQSSGIPSTAGLPPKAGDWRQRAGEILDKGGDTRDVLSTVFGGSR